MDCQKVTDNERLLEQKHQTVKELLSVMKTWDEAADYENTAAFSENMAERQRLLDQVIRIDAELKALIPQENLKSLERSRETDELLRQIQNFMTNDIRSVQSSMDFYLGEAKKLRNGKSGLMAYASSYIPSQKQRYDLIG